MRLVAWNIERGYHPEQIAAHLNGLAADVYLLTEVDRGNGRTGFVDVFARLEAGLGLPGRFAVEFEELPSRWRRVIPQGGPGGGVHGNAVFSRLGVEGYRVVRLPTNERLRWEGKTVVPELFEPRRGGRIAQAFEVTLGGRTVSVINTHLENWRADGAHRRAQLAAALATARGEETLLAGDLNPLDGIVRTLGGRTGVHREIGELRAFLRERGLTDPFEDTDYTCWNLGSRAKLDWLCASPGLRVTARRVERTRWSDHACLVAEIQVVATP